MGVRRFALTRSESEVSRFTKSKDGFLYVFRFYGEGRWDIFKVAIEDVRAAHDAGGSADSLLVGAPQYRVTDGACSCPGFAYRRDCWHRDQVIER